MKIAKFRPPMILCPKTGICHFCDLQYWPELFILRQRNKSRSCPQEFAIIKAHKGLNLDVPPNLLVDKWAIS